MKKQISALAALMLLFASCLKVTDQPATASSSSSEALQSANEQTIVNAVSTTVTTEAALKTAIANAKAGDVITISGTIKLTATLQLLNSGTSSSKPSSRAITARSRSSSPMRSASSRPWKARALRSSCLRRTGR